jgi:hypothetical protein
MKPFSSKLSDNPAFVCFYGFDEINSGGFSLSAGIFYIRMENYIKAGNTYRLRDNNLRSPAPGDV